MMKRVILGGSLVLAAAAFAQPVQWRVEDGGNGHWYEYHASGFIDYNTKVAEARALGGDLSSIGSVAENDLVEAVSVAGGAPCRVAIGARRQCASCPWTWGDTQPWDFTRWAAGEPSNDGQVHVEMFAGSGPLGYWADVADADASCTGYVIEWSADCNNDGIVDKGQILVGQLPDANSNGVPDGCETPFQCGGTRPVDQILKPADLVAGVALDWEVPSSVGSGNQVFVPAKRMDGTRGAVYVFTKEGNQWVQTQKLVAPDGAPDDFFGVCVSAADEWLFVGGRVFRGGGAYAFKRTGTTWNYTQLLTGSGGFFGYRLSTDGTRVVVGTSGETSGTPPVRTYIRSGDTWSFEQELPIPPGNASYWGNRLNIQGDLLWATTGLSTACAYNIYTRASGTWTHQQTITDPSFTGSTNGNRFAPRRMVIAAMQGGTRVMRVYERGSVSVPFTTFRVINPPPGTTFEATQTSEGNLVGLSASDGSVLLYDTTTNLAAPVLRVQGPVGSPAWNAQLHAGHLFITLPGQDGVWRITATQLDADCDGNGIWDLAQICTGQAADLDQDGILDMCEGPCGITTQPTPVTVANGAPSSMFVTSSPSATTYLWHRNGTPLSNNARISGADTATLSISNSQWADQGAYTCLVSGNCGSVMSEPATLTITSCPPAWASTGIEDFGARWVHAQAYSGVNGGTLVFGGRNAAGATLGDTWLRTDSGWANVSSTGPAASTDQAMATLANGRVLLFGGKTDAAANSSAVGDTWEWNGSAWTLLSNTGPAARAGHTLAFDSARNRVILFGGLDANGIALGDTWEWNGTVWTQAATTGPGSRFAHTMAYDPARQRTVLFGGFGPGLLGDTWEWDGTSWTQAATTGVSARFYAAAAFDDSLGRVLLLGGSTGGSVLNDAYVWTGTAWQPRSFTTSPTARWTHAMSYDAAAGRMVITGGAGSGATRFSDAWESSGRPMTTSVPPIALSGLAGDTVQLATTVGGSGPITLRWRKDGANVFNSALYSGVTTPTLTINTTDPSQSGLYTLAITSPCTTLTPTGTLLDIRCGADFNNDGAVDGDDVIGFFTAWDAGDPAGDYNSDGSVDGDDVIGFFGRWDVGC